MGRNPIVSQGASVLSLSRVVGWLRVKVVKVVRKRRRKVGRGGKDKVLRNENWQLKSLRAGSH